MARLAYVYVGVHLALLVLLFAASLLLHLSLFISGPNEAYAKFGPSLFRASVFVGSPVMAFVRNGMWTDQIKSCPKWMWKGALGLGVYSLLIACVQMFFSARPIVEQITISGFPLAFDAIFVCILYSVLWADYLQKSELVLRTLESIAFVILIVVLFLGYRAGYFHRSGTN
jgi:hypothetical protein